MLMLFVSAVELMRAGYAAVAMPPRHTAIAAAAAADDATATPLFRRHAAIRLRLFRDGAPLFPLFADAAADAMPEPRFRLLITP